MKLVPVMNADGSVQLVDIFINDVWHGSRRTVPQCFQYHRQWRQKVSCGDHA